MTHLSSPIVDIKDHCQTVVIGLATVSAGHASAKYLTENEVQAKIDLLPYRQTNLPILHYGTRFLSPRSNIRSIYEFHARAEGKG